MPNLGDSSQITDAIASLQGILKDRVSDASVLTEALSKLDVLSNSFSALFSINIQQIVEEKCEEKERMRTIVLDGLPESDKEYGSHRNLEDLAMVRSISDNLGLDHTIWATERLGVRSHRPRLLKVFFMSSKGASLFLRGFNFLRNSNPTFNKIYARFSQSQEERKRLFELRKEAREKTQTEGISYVVYAGILTKKSEIPALKNRLFLAKNPNSSDSLDSNVANGSHKPRTLERAGAQTRKRTNTRQRTDGTTPKHPAHERYTLTSDLLKEALSSKSNSNWQEKRTGQLQSKSQ